MHFTVTNRRKQRQGGDHKIYVKYKLNLFNVHIIRMFSPESYKRQSRLHPLIRKLKKRKHTIAMQTFISINNVFKIN